VTGRRYDVTGESCGAGRRTSEKLRTQGKLRLRCVLHILKGLSGHPDGPKVSPEIPPLGEGEEEEKLRR